MIMAMSATEQATQTRFEIGPGASLKRAVATAHRLLDDLVSDEMAALGLTNPEADVLSMLHVCDYPPVPSELADWLGLTGAGTTGRLNGLERRGLVERLPHPTDGRSVTVHLTTDGRGLASAVVEAKNSTVIKMLVEQIGEDETTRLIDGLDALSAAARVAMDDS